jgi:hypothetical protein
MRFCPRSVTVSLVSGEIVCYWFVTVPFLLLCAETIGARRPPVAHKSRAIIRWPILLGRQNIATRRHNITKTR